MKSSFFWDITLCSPLQVNRRFESTCCLRFQGRGICQAINQRVLRRDIWLPKDYMMLYPRRLNYYFQINSNELSLYYKKWTFLQNRNVCFISVSEKPLDMCHETFQCRPSWRHQASNRHARSPDLSRFLQPLCVIPRMSAILLYSQESSVSVVTRLQAGQLMIWSTIPGRG
jgi:hypothetical protein